MKKETTEQRRARRRKEKAAFLSKTTPPLTLTDAFAGNTPATARAERLRREGSKGQERGFEREIRVGKRKRGNQ